MKIQPYSVHVPCGDHMLSISTGIVRVKALMDPADGAATDAQ